MADDKKCHVRTRWRRVARREYQCVSSWLCSHTHKARTRQSSPLVHLGTLSRSTSPSDVPPGPSSWRRRPAMVDCWRSTWPAEPAPPHPGRRQGHPLVGWPWSPWRGLHHRRTRGRWESGLPGERQLAGLHGSWSPINVEHIHRLF